MRRKSKRKEIRVPQDKPIWVTPEIHQQCKIIAAKLGLPLYKTIKYALDLVEKELERKEVATEKKQK